jgi:hypothetical protein
MLLGATGCSANRGTDLEADLKNRLKGVEGIERVAVSGQNTLPFMGTAKGTIVLEDDVTLERAYEISSILAPYVEGSNPEYELTIQMDTVKVEVSPVQQQNKRGLALVEQVQEQTAVKSALLAYGTGDHACIVEAEASAADVLAAYEDLVELRERTEGCERVAVEISDGQGLEITDTAVPWSPLHSLPDAKPLGKKLATLRAVLEKYDVESYTLNPDQMVLRIARGEDVAAAERLASAGTDGEVIVSGGKISGWSQDFPAVQLALDLEAMPEVGSVRTDGDTLAVGGVRLEDIAAVHGRIVADPDSTRLGRTSIAGGTATGEPYKIAGTPVQLADRVVAAPDLAAYAPFEFDDAISVNVRTEEIEAMVKVVKPLATFTAMPVRIRDDQGHAVSFQANLDGGLEVEEFYRRKENKPLIDPVMKAWKRA